MSSKDDEAKQAISECIKQLWDANGKEVNPAQFKVYYKQLKVIPLEHLENAITEVLRNHSFNSIPTIGEIFGALPKNDYFLNRAIYGPNNKKGGV